MFFYYKNISVKLFYENTKVINRLNFLHFNIIYEASIWLNVFDISLDMKYEDSCFNLHELYYFIIYI